MHASPKAGGEGRGQVGRGSPPFTARGEGAENEGIKSKGGIAAVVAGASPDSFEWLPASL